VLQYDFEAYIKHACICISEALVPECAHALSHSTFVLLFLFIGGGEKKNLWDHRGVCARALFQVSKQLSDFHKTWYKYDTNTTCLNTTHFNFYNL
jgi:hypothetical protein